MLKLPVDAKPYRNLDDSERVGIAKYFDGGKTDGLGNNLRPGLGGPTSDYFSDLGVGHPVTTCYEWESQKINISVAGGRIFKVYKNGAKFECTGATLLDNGKQATFADFGTSLYLANGGRIVKVVHSSNTCSYVTDPDAPTSVTHIGFIDQYLIALSENTIYFAEIAEPDTWTGEFFQAESLPDKSNALHIGWREVTIFAPNSIEYWGTTTNPTAPFQRFEGANTERGTIAPYSVEKIDNTWFFLDQERKVVRLTGRDPQVISNPFDKEFQKIDVVEDAISLHERCNGETNYVLTFPTAKRTFCYDYKRDSWSERSFWNNATGSRDAYLGLSSCYMRTWNKHLVGSRTDSKIYLVSKDYTSDAGNPIVWELWTGWVGNGDWNHVPELRIYLRRGDGEPGSGVTIALNPDGSLMLNPDGSQAYNPGGSPVIPVLEVYYRDRNANLGANDQHWVGPRHIDLGLLGEIDNLVRLHRLGRYRYRQYRFRCSSGVPIVLSGAEEK